MASRRGRAHPRRWPPSTCARAPTPRADAGRRGGPGPRTGPGPGRRGDGGGGHGAAAPCPARRWPAPPGVALARGARGHPPRHRRRLRGIRRPPDRAGRRPRHRGLQVPMDGARRSGSAASGLVPHRLQVAAYAAALGPPPVCPWSACVLVFVGAGAPWSSPSRDPNVAVLRDEARPRPAPWPAPEKAPQPSAAPGRSGWSPPEPSSSSSPGMFSASDRMAPLNSGPCSPRATAST